MIWHDICGKTIQMIKSMITHDNMTMKDFFVFCKNAKEIAEKYDINNDNNLRDFFRNNFDCEYGYSHKFYVVEEDKLHTVDELIYDAIMELNLHGYKTRFSCQGDNKGTHAYISFDKQLTYEQREELLYLTTFMLKKGLVVRIDRGWDNPDNGMVIRWEKNNISGTYYDNPLVGQWDKLINALMYEAVCQFLEKERRIRETVNKFKR